MREDPVGLKETLGEKLCQCWREEYTVEEGSHVERSDERGVLPVQQRAKGISFCCWEG